MNKPHKHATLIKAWADGAEIEYLNNETGDFEPIEHPRWREWLEYRLKPEPDTTKAIGADIVGVWRSDWKATPFERYISFGQHDGTDEDVDEFGISDNQIFFYAHEGEEQLKRLMSRDCDSEDFRVVSYELVWQ